MGLVDRRQEIEEEVNKMKANLTQLENDESRIYDLDYAILQL